MSSQNPEHCNDCEHVCGEKEPGAVWFFCGMSDKKVIGMRIDEWKNVKIKAPIWCPIEN